MMTLLKRCLVAVIRKMDTQRMFVVIAEVIEKRFLFPVRVVFVYHVLKFIQINGQRE
jgi:hypothetical protein